MIWKYKCKVAYTYIITLHLQSFQHILIPHQRGEDPDKLLGHENSEMQGTCLTNNLVMHDNTFKSISYFDVSSRQGENCE